MLTQWILGFILLVIKLGAALLALLLGAAYLVLAERKLLARMQIRIGPNRAGPFGLLQPIADLIKMMTKEDVIPKGADRVIFRYAPAVAAATAMLIFAVVPFENQLEHSQFSDISPALESVNVSPLQSSKLNKRNTVAISKYPKCFPALIITTPIII